MSPQGLPNARAHPYYVEHESCLFNGENDLFSDFEAPVDLDLYEVTK
jgi:hypothetical protein